MLLPTLPQTVWGPALYAQTARKSTQAKRKTAKTTKAKTPDKKTQLRNEKAATEKARKLSQQKAAQLTRNIRSNLDSVLILDHQIGRQKVSIDSLNGEIGTLGKQIQTLEDELVTLQKQLELKKKRFAKACIMMQKQKSIQQKLMFIFSADNFAQIIRRTRYIQEYTGYQKAQGELIKEKQAEIRLKQRTLLSAKAKMQNNLVSLNRKMTSLNTMKSSCESKVSYLNKNLATVQQQIKEYQSREEELGRQIDRIIQQEIEAARRAEAERKRKAEEARRRAEAEAREKARRLAEAKAAQERARKAKADAEARRRAARTEAEKAAAKAAAEKAEADAKAAEAEVNNAAREEKQHREKVTAWKSDTGNDSKLSSNFASNKGRLPMPITGSYSVVGHYGNYNVSGLKNVTLNNRGIDIRGQQGCSARAIFDGEVSSIFQYVGAYTVMVRHGRYISVYSGLRSVNVRKGQSVRTRDNLGAVAANADGNYVLQFQLHNEGTRLNPEQWVR